MFGFPMEEEALIKTVSMAWVVNRRTRLNSLKT